MLVIDGSRGEGGGQVLRTSLALSLVTRTPFRMENVRARRSRPGLMRQHLTAVKAAAEIGRAHVSGDEVGSKMLEFRPREHLHYQEAVLRIVDSLPKHKDLPKSAGGSGVLLPS